MGIGDWGLGPIPNPQYLIFMKQIDLSFNVKIFFSIMQDIS